jgi:hypothetical protein
MTVNEEGNISFFLQNICFIPFVLEWRRLFGFNSFCKPRSL